MSFNKGFEKTAVSRGWIHKMTDRSRMSPTNVASGAVQKMMAHGHKWREKNPESLALMQDLGKSYKSLPEATRLKARGYVKDMKAILPKPPKGEDYSLKAWSTVAKGKPRGKK